MDAFGFIASLVSSLAWPLAIVALAVVFHTEVQALIKRISRARAGPVELWAEVRDEFVAATVAAPTTAMGQGLAGASVIHTTEDTVGPITDKVQATLTRGSSFTADAVLRSMQRAANPEELAERVVEYVSLRTVPGLRGLSPDRIRLETDLFAAILVLQTRRSEGAQARDPGRLASALERIEEFWSRPELLSDEAVSNTTALVRAVIADMGAKAAE
jgi:hypothetical protein